MYILSNFRNIRCQLMQTYAEISLHFKRHFLVRSKFLDIHKGNIGPWDHILMLQIAYHEFLKEYVANVYDGISGKLIEVYFD